MPEFTVSLAQISLRISALYPSTKVFFAQYLSEAEPELQISVTHSDVEAERAFSFAQDQKEGVAVRNFGDHYLETLAVLRKTADRLPEYDAVLFHGSVVALQGKAYLFTAPSGTGKTTHSRLWLERFPDAYVLNGDKPFLRIQGDCVLACGTPWQGKERYGCNAILPLAAICFLEQAPENSIAPLPFRDALVPMLKQVHRPKGEKGMLQTLRICEKIADWVPFYHLKCNMDPQAAVVSSEAMITRG